MIKDIEVAILCEKAKNVPRMADNALIPLQCILY